MKTETANTATIVGTAPQPQVSETYNLNIHLLNQLLNHAFTHGVAYQLKSEVNLTWQTFEEAQREMRNNIHQLLD